MTLSEANEEIKSLTNSLTSENQNYQKLELEKTELNGEIENKNFQLEEFTKAADESKTNFETLKTEKYENLSKILQLEKELESKNDALKSLEGKLHQDDSNLIQLATDAENKLKLLEVENENNLVQLKISSEKNEFFERKA